MDPKGLRPASASSDALSGPRDEFAWQQRPPNTPPATCRQQEFSALPPLQVRGYFSNDALITRFIEDRIGDLSSLAWQRQGADAFICTLRGAPRSTKPGTGYTSPPRASASRRSQFGEEPPGVWIGTCVGIHEPHVISSDSEMLHATFCRRASTYQDSWLSGCSDDVRLGSSLNEIALFNAIVTIAAVKLGRNPVELSNETIAAVSSTLLRDEAVVRRTGRSAGGTQNAAAAGDREDAEWRSVVSVVSQTEEVDQSYQLVYPKDYNSKIADLLKYRMGSGEEEV